MTSEQTTPRELRLYASGSWLMGIGTAATVCLWSVNAAKPIPHVIYSPAVTTTIMAFLSGLVLAGILTAVKALSRRQEQSAARAEKAVAELGRQLVLIGNQVGRNGYLANQLLAARTIDLVEVRDQLEATARDLTVNAIEDLQKSSGSQYQALDKRVAELGEKVDRMIGAQGGGKVVPMPNPQIYQLGIAEGERRAREGRDKPH